MIHIYWEDDCVYVEFEVSALIVLEGSGLDLPGALRDLTFQVEDWELANGDIAA